MRANFGRGRRARVSWRMAAVLCLALAVAAMTATAAFAAAPTTSRSGDSGVVYGPATEVLSGYDADGSVDASGNPIHEIAAMNYQLNTGPVVSVPFSSTSPTETVSDTITIPAQNGFVNFYYWSVDNSGTVGPVGSILLQMQLLQPETWITNLYATYVDAATLNLMAYPRGGLTVTNTYYRIDGAAPVTIPGSAGGPAGPVTGPGVHTIEYWSDDSGANTESPHKTSSFTIVHTSVPVTTSDNTGTYADTANITLTATDTAGIADTFWRVDGGAWNSGTAVTLGPGLGQTLEYYSVDTAGVTEPVNSENVDVTESDPTAPTTTSDAVATYPSSPAVITLHAEDAGSGLKEVTYVIDGGTPVVVTASLLQSGPSELSPGKTGPPITPYADPSHPSGPLIQPGHTGGADTGSDTLCPACHDIAVPRAVGPTEILNGADWAINRVGRGAELLPHGVQACPACHDLGADPPVTSFDVVVNVSGTGAHTLEYWAEDNNSNVESPHNTDSFTIGGGGGGDTTGPSTSRSGDSGVVYGPANITLTATDAESGIASIWYQLNSGSPISAPMVTDGPNSAHADIVVPEQSGAVTFYYWSVDTAGNVGPAGSTLLQMQRLQPETWITNLYPTYVDSATLNLAAFARGGLTVASTSYRIDGGAEVVIAGSAGGPAGPVTGLGAHTIEYWSVDSGSNVETPHKMHSFTLVHTTVPVTTSDNAGTYVDVANITLTAVDSAGIANTYWRLDDTDGSTPWNTGTTVTTSEEGTHKLEFYSVDNGGVIEPVNTESFSVTVSDNTAPTTTSDAAATYPSSPAVINLHAVDDSSGIKQLTYIVDGGAPVVVTPSPVQAAAGGKAGPPITPYATSGPLIPAVHTGGPDPGNDALCSACHNIATPRDIGPSEIAAGPDGPTIPADMKPHANVNACPACHGIGADPPVMMLDTAVSVSGDGAHTLEFWAEDNKGNVESHNTVNFTIGGGGGGIQPTTIGIATSRTTAGYGRTLAPILTGEVTPDPDMIGQIMHVNVKKPNRATWTYSSNRVIYADYNHGRAVWWHRYVFVSGMARGTYLFRAFYDGNAQFGPSSSSPDVSVRL